MQEPDSNEPQELTNQPTEQPVPVDPHADLRKELTRLREKRLKATDKSIISVLDMRINQIETEVPELANAGYAEDQEKLAREAKAAAKKLEEEEIQRILSLPKPSKAEMDEAEKFIRQARLEKQRGNKQAVTEALTKATKIAPGSPLVMEAMADDLLERKQFKQAKLLLKQATTLDPKNVGLERKYAELVLRGSGNYSIENQLRYGDDLLLSGEDQVAGVWAARLLSAFVPGVGQMVLGRTVKGICLFLGYVVCFAVIVVWQDSFKEFLTGLYKPHAHSGNIMMVVPLLISIAIWIYAMVDLGGQKAKTVARQHKVDRPAPPVDLPFE